MPIDHVLKLYSETIQSPYLHYGFWDHPQSVDLDKVTLQEIKDAQNRYIEHLASFIPEGVKSILDVGCGIGGNADYLQKMGYLVETLSPDEFQKSVIAEKFDGAMTFHYCKFEKFNPLNEYDLILESESACYIKIDRGFEKARETLKPDGYLLVSDYFVYFRDGTKNLHLKSSHDKEKYLNSARAHGFELIREFDQTENTMPTLDYGKYFIGRFINPAIEYGIYSSKKNYPKTAAIIGKMIAPKIESKLNQLELIDSDQFRKYRQYMIYLFQKKDV